MHLQTVGDVFHVEANDHRQGLLVFVQPVHRHNQEKVVDAEDEDQNNCRLQQSPANAISNTRQSGVMERPIIPTLKIAPHVPYLYFPAADTLALLSLVRSARMTLTKRQKLI